MTMKDLAQKSGISYDSVRRKVGSESREITISELSAMAAVLETPITEFMRRAEEAASARGHNDPLDGKDVA